MHTSSERPRLTTTIKISRGKKIYESSSSDTDQSTDPEVIFVIQQFQFSNRKQFLTLFNISVLLFILFRQRPHHHRILVIVQRLNPAMKSMCVQIHVYARNDQQIMMVHH